MKLIEELKARGLVEALTDPEIEKALEKPMTVYCGFDPSARSLQAGNLVSIIVLKRFQQAGHKVIALVGGATGLIGGIKSPLDLLSQPRKKPTKSRKDLLPAS